MALDEKLMNEDKEENYKKTVEWLKNKPFSKDKLEKEIGLYQGTIHKIVTGKLKGESQLKKIEKYFSENMNYNAK